MKKALWAGGNHMYLAGGGIRFSKVYFRPTFNITIFGGISERNTSLEETKVPRDESIHVYVIQVLPIEPLTNRLFS